MHHRVQAPQVVYGDAGRLGEVLPARHHAAGLNERHNVAQVDQSILWTISSSCGPPANFQSPSLASSLMPSSDKTLYRLRFVSSAVGFPQRALAALRGRL